jgi:hypothetical protein
VDRPRGWIACVNAPQTQAELEAVRQSIARGRPFGSSAWTRRTAARLGIESSLRPRGRPGKRQEKPRNKHEKKNGPRIYCFNFCSASLAHVAQQ